MLDLKQEYNLYSFQCWDHDIGLHAYSYPNITRLIANMEDLRRLYLLMQPRTYIGKKISVIHVDYRMSMLDYSCYTFLLKSI